MRKSARVITGLAAVLWVLGSASTVLANEDQAKLYKKVFGGDKPKCITCHVDKIPKKADGKHELNDYGIKVKALGTVPGEDSYKQAGPAPSA